MRAIQLEQFGIEHLQLKEIPTPPIGDYQVLVKVTAASLEFHDLIVVENRIPFGIPLPHIPVYHELHPPDSVFPIEKVQDAFHRFKSGKAFGKVVVRF